MCIRDRYSKVASEEMNNEMRFREDLGFSSLDFMSFLGELEDTFDLELDEMCIRDSFIIEMQAGDDTVSLEIKYDHINVTKIVKNQEVLLDSDHKSEETPVAADRTLLNLEDIKRCV